MLNYALLLPRTFRRHRVALTSRQGIIYLLRRLFGSGFFPCLSHVVNSATKRPTPQRLAQPAPILALVRGDPPMRWGEGASGHH